MDIKITVRDKAPLYTDTEIYCNNSDYTVTWDLDEEWAAYDAKTMRTTFPDGTYEDTVFTGTKVSLPVITAPGRVCIGLYAGEIHTSGPACITAKPSILSCGGAPAAPSEDVYNQIMDKLNALSSPSPKLFYAENEVVAELVTLNDKGDVGYKDVVVYTQNESVSGNEVYYIGDSENWKNWFKFRQSEDGSGLVFNRWSKDGIIDLTIMSSEKLANGVWMATLKNNKKDTYDAIRSTYDIPNREFLRHARERIEAGLSGIGLSLNNKTQIFPIQHGIDFLGFRTYMTDTGRVIRKVREQSRRGMGRRLHHFRELYLAGAMTEEDIRTHYQSWRAHASHGNARGLILKYDAKVEEIFKGG